MTEQAAKRVLVVDDESAIRTSLRAFLEDHQFQVTTAESAEEAMHHLGRDQFDIAVIDLRLPRTSGESLIIQARERNPNQAFLIYTGSFDYQPADELVRLGIDDRHIMIKPAAPLGLIAERIDEILALAERAS